MSDNRSRVKDDPQVATNYLFRNPRRHKSEMDLVECACRHLPRGSSVLDIPCGAGRIMILLANQGYDCRGADLGDGIIEVARHEMSLAGLDCPVDKQDVMRSYYPDGEFDAVICFRFFHHLSSNESRRQVVNELCRISLKYLLISYLSPFAFTSFKRSIRAKLGGKVSRQNATSLTELRSLVEKNNFMFKADYAQCPLLRTLHLAIFEKQESTSLG